MAGLFFEILETINEPEFVVQGNNGELIAARKIENDKHLIAVYRESNGKDGFVITAFLTKKAASLRKRQLIWDRQK